MATKKIKFADLAADNSRPELSDVWEVLYTPIYRVLDEEGVNVADGQLRRIDRNYWLYVDESNGYSILSDDQVEYLIVVAEADDPRLGWDRNVIEL